MRFRNQLAWTLLLQGGGVAAGLVTLGLLGTYLGPAAQGAFSLIKIEVGFIGSFAVFGLTQALFYYVQTARISIGRAKSLAALSSVLGALIALGYGVYVQRWTGGVLLAFAVACAAFARFGCLRGVVLATRPTRSFNMLTALPQGLLLLYAGAAVWLVGRVDSFDVALAFAAAYILSGLVGIWMLAKALKTAAPLVKEEKRAFVMRYGFASGITEVAANVSLWLAAKTVAASLGADDLGVFTLAVTLSQGLLVPLSYASPLLFKRWIGRPDASEAIKAGIWVFLTLGTLAFAARVILGRYQLEFWFGKYAMLAGILWIVLIAAAFDGFQRALVAYVYAQGFPW
jgi:O-antigen/teichoic acid export membrane protein